MNPLSIWMKCLLVVILPGMVLSIGSWTLDELSNRNSVRARLEPNHPFHHPLNTRMFGYAPETAKGYLDSVVTTSGAKNAEVRFIKLDLLFPILYGTAFWASFLWVGTKFGKPGLAAWFLMPLALVMGADWMENATQLMQLNRWPDVDALSLQVASHSTVVKLWLTIGIYASLTGVVLVLIRREGA